MYSDVLIPTDGSEGAKRGIETGLDLAERFGATVHTLYVVDEVEHKMTPALGTEELALEQLEEQGAAALAEVVDEAKARGLDVCDECVRGKDFEAIVDYVEANDIDLVVMGRHGHSDHGHPHIGSCTDRVLRIVDVPVLPV